MLVFMETKHSERHQHNMLFVVLMAPGEFNRSKFPGPGVLETVVLAEPVTILVLKRSILLRDKRLMLFGELLSPRVDPR